MSEYSQRKNVLVIGGAGFIGSNLCEALVKHSNVICVDNYSTGHESNIDYLLSDKHFEFIRHDITQSLDFSKYQDGVERFQFQQSGIQHVYFLASPGSPDWHFKDPLGTMMIHSVGIRNALDLAHAFHSTFLYVSDALVYGTLPDPKFRPTEEFAGTVEHDSPIAFYVQARRFAESLIELYRTIHALNTKTVRMFTVYGPKTYLNDGRMVSQCISDALSHKPITLTKDLKAGSFLYISDAVDALEKIMNSDATGLFNLGHGSEYTIKEVMAKIISLTASRSAVSVGEVDKQFANRYAAWEHQCAVGNISRVKEETGWFPVTLLDEGLRKTIDYLKSLRGAKGLVR